MDSDRNSNRFLGFRRRRGSSGEIKKSKSLALMNRTSFQALFVLLLIAAGDVCEASSLSKHRFLIGEPPKVNSDNSTSPPIPIQKPDPDPPLHNKTGSALPAKRPDPIPDPNNGTKPGPAAPPPASNQTQTQPLEKPTPVPVEKPKPKPKPKPKEKPTPVVPEQKPKENATSVPEKPKEDPNPAPVGVKSPEIGKSKGEKDNVPSVMKENCLVAIKSCSNADMLACIKSFDSELKEAVILVQNVGNSTLMGHLSAENTKPLKILKNQYKKIKLNIGESRKIVVKAGNGECVLQMNPPVSEGNFFMRFPYDKVVTPINGASLLIITVLIFGGTWAACLILKRKQRSAGGVPYQELEMALPESAAATEVVTADGWDQGWDDDWDGENAVKSPGAHVVGSISANGLTARSSNKDGWDNNWDD